MIKRAWDEGNIAGNYLYYDEDTGLIIGEVSRVGVGADRSQAAVYPRPDVNQKLLGQYINYKYAKKAVELYWEYNDRLVIEHEYS